MMDLHWKTLKDIERHWRTLKDIERQWKKTIPQQHLMTTIAQHGEIHNCKTWWNSQTIAKHDEITPHEHNCKLSWNSQTISQHGEIHKQLHTHTTSLQHHKYTKAIP